MRRPLLELKATELLTQDAESGGTTLVDDRNGFNKLSCLEMLLIVRHRWPAGRGLRSIVTGIGKSFSPASPVMHC